jgi:hypothetical protein
LPCGASGEEKPLPEVFPDDGGVETACCFPTEHFSCCGAIGASGEQPEAQENGSVLSVVPLSVSKKVLLSVVFSCVYVRRKSVGLFYYRSEPKHSPVG